MCLDCYYLFALLVMAHIWKIIQHLWQAPECLMSLSIANYWKWSWEMQSIPFCVCHSLYFYFLFLSFSFRHMNRPLVDGGKIFQRFILPDIVRECLAWFCMSGSLLCYIVKWQVNTGQKTNVFMIFMIKGSNVLVIYVQICLISSSSYIALFLFFIIHLAPSLRAWGSGNQTVNYPINIQYSQKVRDYNFRWNV